MTLSLVSGAKRVLHGNESDFYEGIESVEDGERLSGKSESAHPMAGVAARRQQGGLPVTRDGSRHPIGYSNRSLPWCVSSERFPVCSGRPFRVN